MVTANTFSPLLIEEGTATTFGPPSASQPTYPFSPLLIEEGTATGPRKRCPVEWFRLSVLYLSRKALQRRPHGVLVCRLGAFSPLLIEEGTATAATP